MAKVRTVGFAVTPEEREEFVACVKCFTTAKVNVISDTYVTVRCDKAWEKFIREELL